MVRNTLVHVSTDVMVRNTLVHVTKEGSGIFGESHNSRFVVTAARRINNYRLKTVQFSKVLKIGIILQSCWPKNGKSHCFIRG